MKEKIRELFKMADTLLLVLSGLLAFVILCYSGYVLFDVCYVNSNAFTSYDLLQYKPEISYAAEREVNGFSDLIELNEDAVGWITVNKTHINYPIVQGEDDLEYASKDIYGNGSLTGAIYLSCQNCPLFRDAYNVLYGHHMDNGGMFGDIEKYPDASYFENHLYGTLQTKEKNYDLRIFACVCTDAYDDDFYKIEQYKKGIPAYLIEAIRQKAVQFDEAYLKDHTPRKITVLSTCSEAGTNARTLVFADTTVTTQPMMSASTEPLHREIKGHEQNQNHWAFLNLICMIMLFVNFMPVFNVRKKYGQRDYAKNAIFQIDDYIHFMKENDGVVADVIKRIRHNLQLLLEKMKVGVVLEVLLAIIGVIVFFLTEDFRQPVVIVDQWSLLMLLILLLSMLTDFICFRYFGHHPKQIAHLLLDVKDIRLLKQIDRHASATT